MSDESNQDTKYFTGNDTYNCPFCNRKNVMFRLCTHFHFHWSEGEKCYGYIVQCRSCNKLSLHLSKKILRNDKPYPDWSDLKIGMKYNDEIDDAVFYSHPTSFFTIDKRIANRKIRDLLHEAEGCLKFNYFTGASACIRKAIYELLVFEQVHDKAQDYESRIKLLKNKHPEVQPELIDVIFHIQAMASDNVHEQSWEAWDSTTIRKLLEALESVLHEMYVLPDEKKTAHSGDWRHAAKFTRRPEEALDLKYTQQYAVLWLKR